MAVERFNQLGELLKTDSELNEALNRVLSSCRDYVASVVRMEYTGAEVKKRYDATDALAMRSELETADFARKNAHDALIAH